MVMASAPSWVTTGQKVICIKKFDSIPEIFVGQEYTINKVKADQISPETVVIGITLKEVPDFGDENFNGPNSIWRYNSWRYFKPVDTAILEKKLEEVA